MQSGVTGGSKPLRGVTAGKILPSKHQNPYIPTHTGKKKKKSGGMGRSKMIKIGLVLCWL